MPGNWSIAVPFEFSYHGNNVLAHCEGLGHRKSPRPITLSPNLTEGCGPKCCKDWLIDSFVAQVGLVQFFFSFLVIKILF